MPVGIDKSLISELVFKVDSQRFDTIWTWVCRWNARQIAEYVQDSALIGRLLKVLWSIRVNIRRFIEDGLGLRHLLLCVNWTANAICRCYRLAHVMAMAGLLDHISLLNLLRSDDLDLFVRHVVIVLVGLHLVWLIAWSSDACPRRRDRLPCRGSLSSRVRVAPLAQCGACFNLRDLDLLDLLLTATMAGEVLAPRLVAGLVDIWYFLAAALRLITDVRVSVSVLICVIRGTAAAGCSLVGLLNVHDQLFLFCSRVLGQRDLLLCNHIDLALIYHGWLISFLLFFDLLLLLDLRRADGIQVIRHESIGEFVPSDGHGQQVRYAIGKEGLFQDFAHGWALARLLDEHIGDCAFQILRVRVGNGRIVAA